MVPVGHSGAFAGWGEAEVDGVGFVHEGGHMGWGL